MIVKAQNLFPQASQLLSRVSQLIADMLHSLDTEVRDYEMDKLLLKKNGGLSIMLDTPMTI